jgi:hypothetical protein
MVSSFKFRTQSCTHFAPSGIVRVPDALGSAVNVNVPAVATTPDTSNVAT